MLLGLWKNIEDLERNINIEELQLIVNAAHEREHRQNKFTAALKGINLDDAEVEDNKKRVDDIKRRVAARASGKTVQELEFNEMGLDVEIG